MHPILKSQMDRFSKENDIVGSEADQFEIYSIYSLLNGRHGNNVKPADGHLKGTEFGLDGFAVIVNGELVETPSLFDAIGKIYTAEVHFTQSKTSTSFDYGEFAKFIDATMNFIEGNGRQQTTQLSESGEIFERLYAESSKWNSNPSLHLTFIFSGAHNPDAAFQMKRNAFISHAKSTSLFSEIFVEVVGASELQKYYRRATEAASATFEFKNQITLPENDRVKESYIGYLPVAELIKIITDPSSSEDERQINRKIFYDNVRDYDPASTINISIGEELRKSPSSFVFRNNGVTIVARDSSRTADKFTINSYQVVNGCQTCNIIFENFNDRIMDLTVPLRLIVSQDDDFINSIIVGTNKQNAVKDEQFWALRPLLKQFEEYSRAQPAPRTLYFERRENQYRYDNVPEKTRIIEPSALMKSVVSMYLELPHRAGRDYREVKKDFSETLFADDHNVQLYHAAAYCYYRIEFCFRTGRIDPEHKKYRMYMIWAIGAKCGVYKDILSAKAAKGSVVAEEIINFCVDDENLSAFCGHLITEMDKILQNNGLAYDQLRNESTSELLRNGLKATF